MPLATPLQGRATLLCTNRLPVFHTSLALYSSTAARFSPKPSYFFSPNGRWSTHSPPSLKRAHRTDVLAAHTSLLARDSSSPVLSPRRLIRLYAQLSKMRLTTLVVLSAMSGVAMCPLPTTLPILLSTAIGTTLCSASANTLNQIQEVPFDAQMVRTRTRPLVRRAVTPMHAAGFALATGIAGPALLWTMTNPTTALLGLANIGLYAGAYTWLKRRHVVNTWVGAVVGGIPPLMGWSACGGHLLPASYDAFSLFLPPFLTDGAQLTSIFIDNPLSPLALFLLLYSWQFPHFSSLSHITRGSYAQAGYRMLASLNPQKNAAVSLRHSLFLIPLCSIIVPLSGLTTWTFALTALPANVILCRAAWRFWRSTSEKDARVLWQHSLWYLPLVLGLMMVHKQGVEWSDVLGLKWNETEEENAHKH